MRCLALAQTWIDLGGAAILATKPGSVEIEKRYALEKIAVEHIISNSGSADDANEIIALTKKSSSKWIVIDGYHFNENYFRLLKNQDLKIINIDDLGQKIPECIDVVVNPNIYAKNLVKKEDHINTIVLLGPEYYPLRREFIQLSNSSRDFKKAINHILITMGGSDPKNYTREIIKALENCHLINIDVIVLVGPQNEHYNELKTIAENSNFSIKLIKNPINIPELMIWADIGISSAGTTTYELAFMSLPSFLIMVAENQIYTIKAYSENGIFDIISIARLSDRREFCKKLTIWCENPDVLKQKSFRLSGMIDGYGSERILAHIENSLLLRPVKDDDCDRIWKWANDPDVRAFSFHPSAISLDEHKRWFYEKISDKNCKFFIILLNNRPVAQIRFDLKDNYANISIIIDEHFRGRGYGPRIIRMACRYLFRRTRIESVKASVLVINSASIKAFTRAGFTAISTTNVNNRDAILFILKKDDYHV